MLKKTLIVLPALLLLAGCGNDTEAKVLNDTEAPKITCTGNITLNQGESFDYQNYCTVTDNGTLKEVSQTNGIDTSNPGYQTTTIMATDSEGNVSIQTMTVGIMDENGNIPFSFTSGGSIEVTQNGETVQESEPAPTPTPSVNPEEIDIDAPVITVTEDEYTITVGDELPDFTDGASAHDEFEDSDVEIAIEGEVDNSKAGDYELFYVAIDTSGNRVEEPFTVHVKEKAVATATPKATTKPTATPYTDPYAQAKKDCANSWGTWNNSTHACTWAPATTDYYWDSYGGQDGAWNACNAYLDSVGNGTCEEYDGYTRFSK